jgi:ribosome-binding protein aMBF1 (putative translation factor)
MNVERVVDVIKEGEIIRMPESRAVEEDLFILRRVFEPEETFVSSPVASKKEFKPTTNVPSFSHLESWRAGKDNYKKNQVVRDLVENFHWEIVKRRRFKNMSMKELGDAIEASEDEMKMIEFGRLPRDDFIFVTKIENVLGINLRKERKEDSITLADLQRLNEEKARKEIEKLQTPKDSGEISGEEIEIVGD